MLRTSLFLLAILLLATAAFAANGPLDKGSMMINGSFFFRSQSGDLWEYDGNSFTTINIGNGSLGATESYEVAPAIGWFVAPGFFFGAQLNYLRYSYGDNNLHALAIGPAVTYYINSDKTRTEAKGALYPLFGAFFTYGSIGNEDDKIADLFQFGAKGGMLYMISNAVGVEFAAKFQSDSWKFNGATERTSGTTIQIGAAIDAFIF